jgi:hypothetical protein
VSVPVLVSVGEMPSKGPRFRRGESVGLVLSSPRDDGRLRVDGGCIAVLLTSWRRKVAVVSFPVPVSVGERPRIGPRPRISEPGEVFVSSSSFLVDGLGVDGGCVADDLPVSGPAAGSEAGALGEACETLRRAPRPSGSVSEAAVLVEEVARVVDVVVGAVSESSSAFGAEGDAACVLVEDVVVDVDGATGEEPAPLGLGSCRFSRETAP